VSKVCGIALDYWAIPNNNRYRLRGYFGGTGGPIPWLWIGRGITSSSHLRLPLRYYGVYHNMEADQDNSRYTINGGLEGGASEYVFIQIYAVYSLRESPRTDD
jgi:hypothetical protein